MEQNVSCRDPFTFKAKVPNLESVNISTTLTIKECYFWTMPKWKTLHLVTKNSIFSSSSSKGWRKMTRCVTTRNFHGCHCVARKGTLSDVKICQSYSLMCLTSKISHVLTIHIAHCALKPEHLGTPMLLWYPTIMVRGYSPLIFSLRTFAWCQVLEGFTIHVQTSWEDWDFCQTSLEFSGLQ